MKKAYRIAAIRFSSLGDVVLTLPALYDLREQFPDVHVTYVTKRSYADLLEFSPLVDEVVALEEGGSVESVYGELQEQRLDAVLDFHSSLRSYGLGMHLGQPIFRSKATRFRRRVLLLTRLKGELDPVNEMHRYTVGKLVAFLNDGKKPNGEWPPPHEAAGEALFRVPPDARAAVEKVVGEGEKVIALLPGARWNTKAWPVDHFGALAAMCIDAGFTPVLLGSAREAVLIRSVADASGVEDHRPSGRLARRRVICFAEDDWATHLAWLERASVAVGNDSGLTHLAEAMGRRVLMLFGPTVPGFGFRPRLSGSLSVGLPMSCRPCALHGDDKCILEHHDCLEQLDPMTVMGTLYGVATLSERSEVVQREFVQ